VDSRLQRRQRCRLSAARPARIAATAAAAGCHSLVARYRYFDYRIDHFCLATLLAVDMKRLVAFVDLAAISIAILFLFAVIVMSIRSAAITVWQLAREMYAARHDWWLGGLIVFSLIWAAVRWKAAYRALSEFDE